MPANTGTYIRTEYHREITGDRFRTHGMWNTPTHRSWIAMLSRCRNPNRRSYKHYGAKGITVCQRWVDSFDNFLEDMGVRPIGMTLERIDTSGNYCKENCKWETNQEQARNRTSNHVVTVREVTGCLKEICEHFGVAQHYKSIMARINKLKWTAEEAIFTPIRPKRSR